MLLSVHNRFCGAVINQLTESLMPAGLMEVLV